MMNTFQFIGLGWRCWRTKNALRRPDIPTIIPWYFTNYGVNRLGAMPHSQDDDGRKPARLPVVGADGNMSKLMLLRDTYRAGYDTESNPYGGGICFFSWPGWPYTPPKHKTYGGMVHASFADGHVEAFTLSEVKKIAEQPPDGASQFQNRYTRY
jgi:prepilin-type processing-associated H-X9-DG protein